MKTTNFHLPCKQFKRSLNLIVFLLLIFSINSIAQIEQYIKARGKNLCNMAHISNDFIRGSYNISNDNYVGITIVSKDNLFDREITTKLRLIKGFGNLYISDIIIDSDNDIVNPFEGFGIKASLMAELYLKIDRETYNKIRNELIQNFNTDIKNWTGKMWALFALNLDYLDYSLN